MSNIFDILIRPWSNLAMSTLNEFGLNLRTRRSEMGLSQARVAAMSGLSRQTINQLEAGSAPDLGINKVERLASSLGLALRVDTGCPQRAVFGTMPPLTRAAATASVSYKTSLSAAQLEQILVTGQVPQRYAPHLYVVLDEAPVSLLAAVVEQIASQAHIERDHIWTNLRHLARQLKSGRDLWQ
jgi:transcriptional regulator with XRE-family HTH domain